MSNDANVVKDGRKLKVEAGDCRTCVWGLDFGEGCQRPDKSKSCQRQIGSINNYQFADDQQAAPESMTETPLDRLAAQAMQAAITGANEHWLMHPELLAASVYAVAEAMIAEKLKREAK